MKSLLTTVFFSFFLKIKTNAFYPNPPSTFPANQYIPLLNMYQPASTRRPTLLPSQMRRQSQAGGTRRSTIPPSTLKSRQLSHLNAQLARLQANMSDLDNLLRVTAVQAEYIRKLGILHGSLYVLQSFVASKNCFTNVFRFMAGHKVFEEEAMRAQEDAAMAEEQMETDQQQSERYHYE